MAWAKTVLLVSCWLAIPGFLQTTNGVRADISSEVRMTVEANGGSKANVSAKTQGKLPPALQSAIREHFASVGAARDSQETVRRELHQLADTLMKEADDERAQAEQEKKDRQKKSAMCCGKCTSVKDYGPEPKPGDERHYRVYRWRCIYAQFAFYVGMAADRGHTSSDEQMCLQRVMAENKPVLFKDHETWTTAQNKTEKRFEEFETGYGFDKDMPNKETNYDYLKRITWGPYILGRSTEWPLSSFFMAVVPCNNPGWSPK